MKTTQILRLRNCALLLIISSLFSCHERNKYASTLDPVLDLYTSLHQYRDTLEGYDGYWLLKSYPGKDRPLGGYNMMLKFKNQQVEARASEITETLATSFYEMTENESPTLSIITLNRVIGYFNITSGVQPAGSGGDLEYLIQSYKDGVFTLRGRNSQNLLTMTKFTGDVEDYLKQVKENEDLFTGTALSTTGLSFKVNFRPTLRQLDITTDGVTQKAPFIYTPNGIEFYSPISINGKELKGLNLSEDKTQLISEDGSITLPIRTPLVNLIKTRKRISYQSGWVSDNFLSVYDDLATKTPTHNKGAYKLATYGYMGKNSGSEIGLRVVFTKVSDKKTVSAYYGMSFLADSENSDLIHIIPTDPSTNWSSMKYMAPLVELFKNNSPYLVEEQGDYILFTSSQDKDIWFYLYN